MQTTATSSTQMSRILTIANYEDWKRNMLAQFIANNNKIDLDLLMENDNMTSRITLQKQLDRAVSNKFKNQLTIKLTDMKRIRRLFWDHIQTHLGFQVVAEEGE